MDLGDRPLHAFIGVEDAEQDAIQAAGQLAVQELALEILGLGLIDVDADDLTAATFVHRVGDHEDLVAHSNSSSTRRSTLRVETPFT